MLVKFLSVMCIVATCYSCKYLLRNILVDPFLCEEEYC